MESKLITNKATWSFQEILPILLAVGLGVFGIFLGVTEDFTVSGAIITAVAGFGLALYVLFISSRRKWKSTLFAKITYDKNFNVDIWMRKPIVEKWAGKLDKTKNTGKLSRISSIQLETIKGTRLLHINTLDNKPIYMPVRLFKDQDIKDFVAKAVESKKGKIKFESEEQAKEFATLIAGASTFNNVKAEIDETLPQQRKMLKAEPLEEEATLEEVSLELTERPKTVKKLGYGEHRKAGTTEIIATAVYEASQKADAEEKAEGEEKLNSLMGKGNAESVPVELDTSENK